MFQFHRLSLQVPPNLRGNTPLGLLEFRKIPGFVITGIDCILISRTNENEQLAHMTEHNNSYEVRTITTQCGLQLQKNVTVCADFRPAFKTFSRYVRLLLLLSWTPLPSKMRRAVNMACYSCLICRRTGWVHNLNPIPGLPSLTVDVSTVATGICYTNTFTGDGYSSSFIIPQSLRSIEHLRQGNAYG